MDICAKDFAALKDLLEPCHIAHEVHEDLIKQDIADLAKSLARIHLADSEKRLSAAARNSTWQWIHQHSAYKVFYKNAISRRSKKWGDKFIDSSEALDSLAKFYERKITNNADAGYGATLTDLDRSVDPLIIIYARCCASALARAFSGTGDDVTFNSLKAASRNLQKAIKSLAPIVANNSNKTNSGNNDIKGLGRTDPIESIVRNMERSAERIRREIVIANRLRRMHGPVRSFLTYIILDLGTRRCGTPSALVRLAEMADPETVISEDTVSRIIKEIQRRFAKFQPTSADRHKYPQT